MRIVYDFCFEEGIGYLRYIKKKFDIKDNPKIINYAHVANNNWDRAHELAQDQDDKNGAWVHAHLHRVEGDLRNAGYWYRRADKSECTAPLETEWDDIATAIL